MLWLNGQILALRVLEFFSLCPAQHSRKDFILISLLELHKRGSARKKVLNHSAASTHLLTLVSQNSFNVYIPFVSCLSQFGHQYQNSCHNSAKISCAKRIPLSFTPFTPHSCDMIQMHCNACNCVGFTYLSHIC